MGAPRGGGQQAGRAGAGHAHEFLAAEFHVRHIEGAGEVAGQHELLGSGLAEVVAANAVAVENGLHLQAVIEQAREQGYNVREEPFTLYEVYTAEECFLTGTAAEVIPVVMVDGRKIGAGKPGPVFATLLAKFQQLTLTDGPEIYPEG